jgi:hypothetical protein
VAGGSLSTAEGPAWKPLAVLVCALFGGAWPTAWVVIARAGAVAAVGLAWVVARELADGRGQMAGAVAAAGVALTGGFLSISAQGQSEGLFVALAFGGALAMLRGSPRVAVACFVGCALLRVESWPFLVVLAWWCGWRWRIVAAAAGVLALWFVPEWIGSGELLRSADRARVPNPGQPAAAAVPALASLEDGLTLLFWPLAIAAAFAPRRAQLFALVGFAWIALVASMAQAGFSGEWRYALPGAAAVAVAGAAGIAARPRVALVLAVPALVLAGVRLADLPAIREREQYRSRMAADLRLAVDAAGGTEQLAACGRPYVGGSRGPLLAYALEVEKRRVGFDARAPGVVFRSRSDPGAPVEPAVPDGFHPVARAGGWIVLTSCR